MLSVARIISFKLVHSLSIFHLVQGNNPKSDSNLVASKNGPARAKKTERSDDGKAYFHDCSKRKKIEY